MSIEIKVSFFSGSLQNSKASLNLSLTLQQLINFKIKIAALSSILSFLMLSKAFI